MKKTLFFFAVLSVTAIFTASVQADDISNNFSSVLARNESKPFNALAQDLGVIMGGGSFHYGETVGFPIGFDVGAHGVVTGVQKDDTILKDDGSTVNGGVAQVEIGLPAKINVIGRFGKVVGGDLIGGGLALGLFKSSVPGIPSVSISALYDQLKHDYFKAKTYTANAALSFDLPFVDPYVGVGYDYTQLDPTARAFEGLPASVDRGIEGKSGGYRAEVGVNLHLIPFTYLTVGAGVANGRELYHAGAGVRF